MPVRASYLLKVGGRLKGGPSVNEKDGTLAQIQAVFPASPPQSPGAGFADQVPGAGWPQGFVLNGYNTCFWRFDPEIGGYQDQETRFSFRAEVHHLLPGTLYDNRVKLLADVAWFYKHRDYRWHQELKEKLEQLNQQIEKKLIERIWFRDWQWYCGNGGDM